MSSGWYPEDSAEISSLVADWTQSQKIYRHMLFSPHAGWYFLGI